MIIKVNAEVTVNGRTLKPDENPHVVDDEVGEALARDGKVKGYSGPPADKMVRTPPAKKAPGANNAPQKPNTIASRLCLVIPTSGRADDLDLTLHAAWLDAPDRMTAIVVNDAPDTEARAAVRQIVEGHQRKPGRIILYAETIGGEGVAKARIRGNEMAAEHATRAHGEEETVIVELDDHDTPEPGALRAIANKFIDAHVRAAYGDLYRVAGCDNAKARAHGADAPPKGAILTHVQKDAYTPGLFLDQGNQAWGVRAYRLNLYRAVGGRRPDEAYASEYALFLRFEQHIYADEGARAKDALCDNGMTAICCISRPLCRWPVAVSNSISFNHKSERDAAADRYAYLARAGALLTSSREGLRGSSLAAGPVPLQPDSLLLDGQPVEAFPLLSSGDAPTVSVVIPCYKSQKYVGPLAASLAADECVTPRELIWVIDGKDQAAYPGLPGKVVVRPENGGFAAAVNTGARYGQGSCLCLLNADTEVTPGWLDSLSVHVKDNGVGAVGPQILRGDGSVDSLGSRFDWKDGSFQHITDGDIVDVDMATAACIIIDRAAWDAVGGLDEAYKIGYWEDADLCMKIRQAGYQIGVGPDAVVVHHCGHTGSNHHRLYSQNRQLFHERWVRTGLVDKFARERGECPHDGKVTVCILALNEAEYIGPCIESVYPLANRIIVVEGGNEYSASYGACRSDGTSTDQTRAAVEAIDDPRNIIEFHAPPDGKPWPSKTEARQHYLDMLDPGDWCLAVDADEVFWDSTLWRLSATMHEADYITANWVTFWGDFNTIGTGKWNNWRLDRRFFRVRKGYRYATHLQVVNADGMPIDKDPTVRRVHAAAPVVAHYAWVKPLPKIAAKVEYYRRQCPGRVLLDDYVDRVFLADAETVNRIGSHPMGGGNIAPFTGRHPDPIARRLRDGRFGWLAK